jgi:hypothetical protein
MLVQAARGAANKLNPKRQAMNLFIKTLLGIGVYPLLTG